MKPLPADVADCTIDVLYLWTCWTCRDPEDPNVPGAYGETDSRGEAQRAITRHKREVHGAS